MLSECEIIEEFKQRRAETWGAAKLWLLLAVVGFIGAAFVGDLNQDSPPELWKWGVLFFALIFVSILRLVFVVRAKYRCPACEEILMQRSTLLGPGSIGVEEGVALSPARCSHCGAKLK